MWRKREDLGERVKSEDKGQERVKWVETEARERQRKSVRQKSERKEIMSQGHLLLKNQFNQIRKTYFLTYVKWYLAMHTVLDLFG